MNRRPIIAGNIKMYLTIESALELFKGVWSGLSGQEACDVVYFPPATVVADASRLLRESSIETGGQNMHWELEGAFTGEISPRMLLNAGCRWVLIGHSERRTLFGETDEQVNRKVRTAIEHGLKPMVCIGETLEERESDRTEAVLRRQVAEGLAGLPPGSDVVVAYEPVWAIGTGKTATPAQANSAHAFIRKELGGLLGSEADTVRILYGGSVKPDNAAGLMAEPEIDGALVGGACLNPDSFLKIIRATGRA